MKRLPKLLAGAFTTVLFLSSCAAGDVGKDQQDAGKDGQIVVTAVWGGAEQKAFENLLRAFTAKTGVDVRYEPQRSDYATVLRTRIAGGNAPDVAVIPGIGYLRGLVRDGLAKPLKNYGVERAAIEGNYPPGILDVGTVDSELYAVMLKLNSKATVWYKPESFRADGFQPPRTFADLVSVTKAYKAKGKIPWAVGAKDGWTLTDWFEMVYLRQAGPGKYDDLFSGKLPWTDPSVSRAIDTVKQIINEEHVAGGINGALGTGFVDAMGQTFGGKPAAEMFYEGGFVGPLVLEQVNPQLSVGKGIDFFPFPGFDGGDATQIVVGGDLAAAFTDKPGVKEFLQFITSPESGDVVAKDGTFVTPLKTVDPGSYPSALTKKEAQQVASASAVRYDGSDLLPAGPDFGALLQTAIKGGNPPLAQFQEQVADAWNDERG
ncbi:ABC transporter substrate-binding protein [Couchioplanes caeruleus]|uniref:Carbohydrate ABC transporter substrate-binding protein (CUT1 family) n=2 Tax=Couchioplanes caeruleus TaxID=56438 RepID=A0A1K0FC39_9ACTN|nr:extracellular solute-binding protein [Couchioplanes caeruleus]OJF10415.1 hypothetical protein BG844_32320 [Couchioplanes caeruleus subsp. caeruleus]ROP29811.1 carbohydrate ABC transporter substrate-binding protein (CUT1 family) [Couchioplanes caeruleus]